MQASDLLAPRGLHGAGITSKEAAFVTGSCVYRDSAMTAPPEFISITALLIIRVAMADGARQH
jgi:hypothetical protein